MIHLKIVNENKTIGSIVHIFIRKKTEIVKILNGIFFLRLNEYCML
jgi:hypothetical protein